ncbi:MAG TPA: DUF4382 domain-containing protein [Candidatus Saccharimonadaceae bacterium]|jgi:hypothetical protein|nr:DUF4382 domain-containing protein [Candidatus Saccharimonadaceae bacterium]
MHRIATALGIVLLVALFFGCSKSPSKPAMGQVIVHMTDAPAAFDAVNIVVDQVAIHASNGSGDDGEPGDSLEVGEPEDSTDTHEADDDSTETHESDHDSSDVHQAGWEVLSHDTQTIDLLALRNGTTTQIGVGMVPAGHYTQVRLRLGAGSNVVVDGVAHPLTIPSGMQSGLKLIGPFSVSAGGTTQLTLDFIADQSVVLQSDGTYRLQPTIKMVR